MANDNDASSVPFWHCILKDNVFEFIFCICGVLECKVLEIIFINFMLSTNLKNLI